MRAIRWILGKFILTANAVFPPKKIITRNMEDQNQVDQETKNLTLYQFNACPFCVKVRRAAKRFDLDLQTKDARNVEQFRQELLAGGGKIKTPCLNIKDASGNETWMYESNDIIAYLEQRFVQSTAKAD